MLGWILVVFLVHSNAGGAITIPFSTLEECKKAGESIIEDTNFRMMKCINNREFEVHSRDIDKWEQQS